MVVDGRASVPATPAFVAAGAASSTRARFLVLDAAAPAKGAAGALTAAGATGASLAGASRGARRREERAIIFCHSPENK